MSDVEALRVGTDGLVEVQFVDGYRPLDLTSYTVTALAKQEGQSGTFVPTVSAFDASTAIYRVSVSGSDIAVDADILVEFTITGSPTLNPPGQMLRIPVRAQFTEQ